jgi:hypothetical protein
MKSRRQVKNRKHDVHEFFFRTLKYIPENHKTITLSPPHPIAIDAVEIARSVNNKLFIT